MSFWQKIKASVAGFSEYPALIRAGVGGAIGYLAVWLLIVVAVAGTLTISRSLGPLRQIQVAMIRLPDFGLRDGEVYFSGPMPFKTQGDDGTVLIVDTNATSDAPLRAYDSGMLITRDHIYRKLGDQVQDTDLSGFKAARVNLSRADIVRFIGAAPVLIAILQIFRYVWDFVAKLLCALVLGLIGLLAARSVISFEGTFTAGLYALTLPAAIDIILPRPFVGAGLLIWLIHWALAITFTLGGVAAAARQAREGRPPLDPPATL